MALLPEGSCSTTSTSTTESKKRKIQTPHPLPSKRKKLPLLPETTKTQTSFRTPVTGKDRSLANKKRKLAQVLEAKEKKLPDTSNNRKRQPSPNSYDEGDASNISPTKSKDGTQPQRTAMNQDEIDEQAEALTRRIQAERDHYETVCRLFYINSCLSIPNCVPLPQPKSRYTSNYADILNKTVPIYITDVDPYPQDVAKIRNYIYKQWAQGDIRSRNIEKDRFFGVPVCVEQVSHRLGERTCLDDVKNLHVGLISRFLGFGLLHRALKPGKYPPGGCFVGACDWTLSPIFRALILVIEECDVFTGVEELRVNMVLTGETNGLSEPINFGHFGEEWKDEKQIEVSLTEAVEFVLFLEEKETDMREWAEIDGEGNAVRVERPRGEIGAKSKLRFDWKGEDEEFEEELKTPPKVEESGGLEELLKGEESGDIKVLL